MYSNVELIKFQLLSLAKFNEVVNLLCFQPISDYSKIIFLFIIFMRGEGVLFLKLKIKLISS
jgi:hypothetical protein